MLDTSLPNVRVYTQSCIRISGANGGAPIVYLDPFRMPEEPHDADYALVTHAHFDHFSPEDLARVMGPHAVIIAPSSMEADIRGCAVAQKAAAVHFMSAGDVLELPGLAVEAVPAYNVQPERLGCHPRENGWLGYVLTIDGVRYYAAGDTDQTPGNEQVRCDVALIPIGGTYTMDPAQAAAFANTIAPRVVVPIHYGSIVGSPADADAFAAAVDPAIDVILKLER